MQKYFPGGNKNPPKLASEKLPMSKVTVGHLRAGVKKDTFSYMSLVTYTDRQTDRERDTHTTKY